MSHVRIVADNYLYFVFYACTGYIMVIIIKRKKTCIGQILE